MAIGSLVGERHWYRQILESIVDMVISLYVQHRLGVLVNPARYLLAAWEGPCCRVEVECYGPTGIQLLARQRLAR